MPGDSRGRVAALDCFGVGLADLRVAGVAIGGVAAAARVAAAIDLATATVVGLDAAATVAGSVAADANGDVLASGVRGLVVVGAVVRGVAAAAIADGPVADGSVGYAGRDVCDANGARVLETSCCGCSLRAIPTTTTAQPATAAQDATEEATRPNDMATSVPCLVPM